MGRFHLVVWAALLWALTAGASFADQFAFAVPGAPGSTLRFVGFDAKGEQIFAALASQQEQHNGALHYVVRVDKGRFAGRNLARWCVSDGFQKWAPVKDVASKTVCDDTPKQRNGTYTFEIAELWPRKETAAPSITPFMPAGIDLWWGPEEAVTEWTRFCRPDDATVCLMRRDVLHESGVVVATMVLRSQPGSDMWMSQVRLPMGTSLVQPTIWQIDAGEAWNMRISYCYGQWCVAGTVTPPEGIAMLKRGNRMTVEARGRDRALSKLTFGLDGFTKAFDGEPALHDTEQAPEVGIFGSSGWQKTCEGRACLYQTSIGNVESVAGNLVLHLLDGAPSTLLVGVTPGLDLSKGPVLKYGKDASQLLTYTHCQQHYCTAGINLPEDGYQRLLAEGNVTVIVRDLVGEDYNLDFDLGGFIRLIETND